MRKPFFILIPIAILLGVSLIVMTLWNTLIPVIFGLKVITYFQAMGLLVLSRILFGGFGFGKGPKRFAPPPFMRNNMNAEEKEKFREEWRNRCRKP